MPFISLTGLFIIACKPVELAHMNLCYKQIYVCISVCTYIHTYAFELGIFTSKYMLRQYTWVSVHPVL